MAENEPLERRVTLIITPNLDSDMAMSLDDARRLTRLAFENAAQIIHKEFGGLVLVRAQTTEPATASSSQVVNNN